MGQTIENELDEPKTTAPAAPPPAENAAAMKSDEVAQAEAALAQLGAGEELSLAQSLVLGRLLYNMRHNNKPPVPFDELGATVQDRYASQAVAAARTFTGAHAPSPGEVAYTSYCAERGWLGFNGDVLPLFNDSKPELQQAWEVAARTVLDVFKLVEQTSASPKWLFKAGDRVRHKKSGGEYTIVADHANGLVIEDNGAPAYTYVASPAHVVWVRPAVELEERFELVNAQPAAPTP